MPKSLPGRTLVGVRFVLGLSSWLTPRFFMRALWMDPQANPQAGYMARLFGIRDITLGLGLVLTHGSSRRLWWGLGMLCDLGDLLSGVLSARHGELPSQPRVLAPMLVAAGAIGASLGAAALLSDDV